MSNRPRNYREALDLINLRRDRLATSRTLSTRQEYPSGPSGPTKLRDQIVAHTDEPLSTYSDNPPPVSFRQWHTDIATFYPGDSVLVRPWPSVSTRARMDDMGLPCVRSATSMGLTRNQAGRLMSNGRVDIKGFPYGAPAGRPYLLGPDRTLYHDEPEVTDTVYVEASEGVHAAYNLGRRRVLRVLREYCAMVDRLGEAPPYKGSTTSVRVDGVCLAAPSLKWLREEWLPTLLESRSPGYVRSMYNTFRERGGCLNMTGTPALWTQKQVPSGELDQWL